ncbi:ComEC/Rec2 family competence protein [Clostridium sp. CTA-19]
MNYVAIISIKMIIGDYMERPLIFYAICILIGNFSALFLLQNVYFIFCILLIFLIISYIELEKHYFFFVLAFIFIGFVSYSIYFTTELGQSVQGRIIENNNGKVIAKIESRKVLLEGNNLDDLKLGQLFNAKGLYIKDLDYKNGIIGVYKTNKIEKGKDSITKIYNIKNNCYNKIAKYDEDIASIVMAISLGDKSYLDYEKKNDMNTLGIVHILTVSGFHIALIYKCMEKLLGYKISILITLIYITIIGYTASTVRAFIMICVFVLSKKVYRNYDGISSLALAFIIVVTMNPYYILDPAFNLSFLSVLGIFVMNKKFDKTLYFLPKLLRDSIVITLSASTFTTLYIAFNFGTVNLNGIVGNCLLIPFYTILIIASNMFLFIIYIPKINTLFLCFLKGLLLCINTFEGFLIKDFNQVYNVGYVASLTILSMYCSYIFYKSGYKKSKYIPVIMLMITIISQYSFYPNIHYIKTKKGTTININYKMKNVILSNKSVKLSKIKEPLDIHRIYDEIDCEKNLNLDNKYNIKAINSDGYLDLIIACKNKKIFITEKENYSKANIDKYNIVELVEDDKYKPKGTIYGKYKLINEDIVKIYY